MLYCTHEVRQTTGAEMSNQISTVIYEQMGGHKFSVMVSAKYMSVTDGLRISFKGSRKANLLTIILKPNDTYTMVFGRLSSKNYKVVKTIDDIYCDQLQNIFTEFTGLATHL